MSISIFDIFTVGIGPSSSHTVGPMKAAKNFIDCIIKQDNFNNIHSIKCDFYGSLALTGKGHGTDKAFILGIQGYTPESIDSDRIQDILNTAHLDKKLILNFSPSEKEILFNPKKDIKFHRRVNLPFHPNGMAFAAFDDSGKEIFRDVYYSIGGGFILTEEEANNFQSDEIIQEVKYPFNSAKELIQLCKDNDLRISKIIYKI